MSDSVITASAFSRDRSTLWYATGGARCEVRALSIEPMTERVAFTLDSCPTSVTVLEDESLLLTDGARLGAWRRPDGSDVMPDTLVVAAAGAMNYVRLSGDRFVWQRGEFQQEIGTLSSLRAIRILPVNGDLLAIRLSAESERIVRISLSGENDVSGEFAAIDSMDAAPRGDEIVFSARRENGFDVAIASTDGTTVNWVAPDRADEVGVTWAPRGNKISYRIRGVDSTLVRSVHVPTSFQLTFDVPHMSVREIAWDSRAERFAMILDGPTASPHIDWIEYGGGGRATLAAPRDVVAREPERVTFGPRSSLLLGPATVRYGEKLPLFIRLTEEPLAWQSDLRDLESFGGGILLLSAKLWGDGARLTALLDELKWVDPAAIVVVDLAGALASTGTGFTEGRTLVTLGTKRASDRFFSQRELPGGGSVVVAEDWRGAMEYLRGRFKTGR
ncbi:MAG: hypothetical protein ACSLFQ_13295 [Thermoanaerobaculia bacterium]